MAEVWVISDTHFNHGNIIKYCDRPFDSIDQMNEHMITQWNNTVSPQDKVYHLGDVYISDGEKANEILKRLNGKKRLILGNHDNGKDQILSKNFQEIYMWRDLREFGLLLSHVPIHPNHIRGGGINVHGHIHNLPSPEGKYINVSVEAINYTPVNIEKLRVK